MWRWLERRSRLRRAKNYLRLYPRDQPAVRGILAALDSLHPKNARDAAEIGNGRELSEAEWGFIGKPMGEGCASWACSERFA